jgi:hypothetical protein
MYATSSIFYSQTATESKQKWKNPCPKMEECMGTERAPYAASGDSVNVIPSLEKACPPTALPTVDPFPAAKRCTSMWNVDLKG